MPITLQEDWSSYDENTEVQNITGWSVSAPFENDKPKLQVNATSQLKNTSTNRMLAFYDSGASNQYIEMTVVAWPNFLGIAVRCLNDTNYIGIRPFGADVQVYHKTGSSTFNQIQMISGAAVTIGDIVSLRLEGDTLKFLKNDVQYGSDMDVTGIQSGTNVGMYLTPGDPVAGSIEIGTILVEGITLDEPYDGKVFPVFGATREYLISGSYYSLLVIPFSIEYKVEDFVSGATIIDWSLLDEDPTDGLYSGLVNIPKGNYYKIKTRFSNDLSYNVSGGRIGFGIVFEVGGQSNSLRLTTTTTTTPPNANTAIFDKVSQWSVPTNEAIIDILNHIATTQNCVVAVYTTAVNGSNIASHLPGGTNYPDRQSALVAAGGELNLIWWGQGEADVSTPQRDEYPLNLTTYRADILSRTGQTPSSLPMFIVQLGRNDGAVVDLGGWDAIREAQTDFANNNEAVYISHQTMDLTMSDTLHRDDAGRQQEMARFNDSYNSVFLGGISGRGPIVIQAIVEGSDVKLTHNLNGSSAITLPLNAKDGYEVSVNDFASNLLIDSVSVDAEVLTLTMSSPPIGTVKVRSQHGIDPEVEKFPLGDKVYLGQAVMVEPLTVPIEEGLITPVVATFNVNGIPDGTYLTTVLSKNRPSSIITSENILFNNGIGSVVLNVPAETQVYGLIRDNLEPSINVAPIKAITQ